jgi:hypothetical protein
MPEKKIGVAVMINESTAGGRIAHLLATYAYDRLLNKDTNENYVKQLHDIAGQYGKMKEQMVASFRSRASRTSQLSRPLADYTGRYTNDSLGNIDISVEQNTLAVRMGNIRVLATPFTQKDTIRVEMEPGQGEVIRFDVNSSGQVEALNYAEIKFARHRPKP